MSSCAARVRVLALCTFTTLTHTTEGGLVEASLAPEQDLRLVSHRSVPRTYLSLVFHTDTM
jgi:hypothetical protein